MNQEPSDCVATYLGLQGFAVVHNSALLSDAQRMQ